MNRTGRWRHRRPLDGLCTGRKVLLYMRGRRGCYAARVGYRFHVRDRAGTRSRAWVRGDDLGVGAAATRLLTIGRLLSSGVLGKGRIGMRGATVEDGEGGVDADLKMPPSLTGGIIRVEPRDAHHDLDGLVS